MANILIVDDDQSILRLLEFTLQRAGHEVTTFEDSPAGLAAAEARPPDLIVVDVMMPKMTGYEFCKTARTKVGLKEIPIIMFSARFQAIDKRTALAAGATDYLSKTTSPNDLVERITELLPSANTFTENIAIGLFSLRGGAGLTSLAVNIALSLALNQKRPTALVDLARLGGHTALMLGLRPTSSLSQALSATTNEITADTIKPHLIQHASGVQLLASAPDFNHALLLSDKRLSHFITALKSTFSFTILDIPHVLDQDFAPTLQLFDKITLILSPDMPSLQSTAVALQSLARLGIPEQKISLVVNQMISTNALSMDMIQRVVKRSILAVIPYEPEMVKSVNSGKPLLLRRPESAGATAIVQLTDKLLKS